jgi:hypothetical protein
VLNEVLNLDHQVFHAAEGAASDGLLRDDVEPDFDLVEPGSIGGRVVHLKPGVGGQPAEHAGVLLRSVVVHDQVLDAATATGQWKQNRGTIRPFILVILECHTGCPTCVAGLNMEEPV